MSKRLLLILFLSLLLSACAAADPGPDGAVETYLTALVSKDGDAAINASCLDWENQAQAEVDSFLNVEASLTDDFACQTISEEGDQATVECDGMIVFVYGEEVQNLPLEERTYLAQRESGEWRMCGYR